MALLAHAFLAVLAAAQADHQNPDDDQLIPLTCRDGNDAEPDRWRTVMTDSRQQLRRQVSMLEV